MAQSSKSLVLTKYFYKCLFCFIVIIVTNIAAALLVDTHRDPVPFVADRQMNIYSIFDRDTVVTPVNQGDTLHILGYMGAQNSTYRHRFFVANDKGVRGCVFLDEIGYRFVSTKSESNDTLTVTDNAKLHNDYNYECVTAGGETVTAKKKELEPVLPEEIANLRMSEHMYTYYMSEKRFGREFIGQSFADNSKRYREAYNVAVLRDTLRAVYNISVVERSTGVHCAPIVSYNDSLTAISVAYDRKGTASDWIIRYLPFVCDVMDLPFLTSLTQTMVYDRFTSPLSKTWWKNIPVYAMLLLYVIFALIWVYFTPALPILAIGLLLNFRQVFRPFGDKTMHFIILLVTVASTVVWTCALLGWGIYSVPLLLLYFSIKLPYRMVINPLTSDVPHKRCLQCRQLYSMDFLKTELIREYDKWFTESEFARTLSTKTERWKSWTEVTTTYSDGHQEKRTKDEMMHKRKIDTDLYNDYDVLYHVKEFKHTYKCGVCGNEEYTQSMTRKELDRRLKGHHISESTSEI
ncbi:MAG: hypothetical protein ACI4TW_00740 [Prevotella sp.]